MDRLKIWLQSFRIFQRRNLQQETEFTRNVLHCPECGKGDHGKVGKTKSSHPQNGNRNSTLFDKNGSFELTTGRTVHYFKTAHCQGCKKEVYKTVEYGWIIVDVNKDRFYQITGDHAEMVSKNPVLSNGFERGVMRSFRSSKRKFEKGLSFGRGGEKKKDVEIGMT